jgi:hypothetical protein
MHVPHHGAVRELTAMLAVVDIERVGVDGFE